MTHIISEKKQKLEINPLSHDEINDVCKVETNMGYEEQNVEGISQHGEINSIFK